MDTHSLARKQHRAFTLIELLVVTAIISILLGVVITSQSSFNQSVILNSTAYDMGLSIRLAKSYGLSGSGISGVPGVGSGMANYGYGIDIPFSSSGTNSSYTLFADTGEKSSEACHAAVGSQPSNSPDAKIGDCLYRSSGSNIDTPVHQYTINNGVTVKKICLTGGGSHYCSVGTTPTLQQLDITFIRPGTKAFIRGFNNGFGILPKSSDVATQLASSACIELQAAGGGSTRTIDISEVGTITVTNTSCS